MHKGAAHFGPRGKDGPAGPWRGTRERLGRLAQGRGQRSRLPRSLDLEQRRQMLAMRAGAVSDLCPSDPATTGAGTMNWARGGPGAGRRTDSGRKQVQYRGGDLLLDAVAKGRQGWSGRRGSTQTVQAGAAPVGAPWLLSCEGSERGTELCEGKITGGGRRNKGRRRGPWHDCSGAAPAKPSTGDGSLAEALGRRSSSRKKKKKEITEGSRGVAAWSSRAPAALHGGVWRRGLGRSRL